MDRKSGGEKRVRQWSCLITLTTFLCTIILVCGCGNGARDVSTPRQALLGQWKPVSSSQAYIFFSPDTATYLPAESGESIALRYEVVEENADEFRITIRFVSPTGSEDEAEPFVIEFTADRNGFFLYPASVPERLEYVYVDERQAP